LNFGAGENLYVDPTVMAAYNKSTYLQAGGGSGSIQRIVLAGSAQDASGADLKRQWVSDGTVNLEVQTFSEVKCIIQDQL